MLRNSDGRLKLAHFHGQKFYVDRNKFAAILVERQNHVGRLASGWAPAALAAGIALPQWIARHGGSRGLVQVNLLTTSMRMSAANLAPGVTGPVRGELGRRIPYAVEYQRSAMVREINYMVFKNAQANAIATRNFSNLVPEGMQGG